MKKWRWKFRPWRQWIYEGWCVSAILNRRLAPPLILNVILKVFMMDWRAFARVRLAVRYRVRLPNLLLCNPLSVLISPLGILIRNLLKKSCHWFHWRKWHLPWIHFKCVNSCVTLFYQPSIDHLLTIWHGLNHEVHSSLWWSLEHWPTY